ncbi:unnamed protein product [Cylicocyclus nassatus]|uniref:GYF domain-containing protein n=1 Tax=Cylicocyclus nassatus TaxID=53992 RepID=A0AA36GZK7_CYLNA|nr:unnamed protein product [Cylicocyclus nassatus]
MHVMIFLCVLSAVFNKSMLSFFEKNLTLAMPLFSYIDENEQLRGPFEGVQMHYWYLKKYLPPTLHIFVHYGLYGRSTTLEELRERNGDLNPFFELVTLRRGNPYKPLSSNSNSHSSLSYGSFSKSSLT